MTIVESLQEARKLIERGWCQNAFAKDKYGEPVAVRSKSACAWCAAGAIAYVCQSSHRQNCFVLFSSATKSWKGVDAWNDMRRRTKKQILATFDKAIVLARAEEIVQK